MYYLTNFAQAYGEGNYGTSTYQDGTTTSTTTSVGSGSNGGLTDTGFDILVVATIACFVIFLALLVRFWRKPSKKTASPG